MKKLILLAVVALSAVSVNAQIQLGPSDYIIYDEIVVSPKAIKTIDGVDGYMAVASKFHRQDGIAVFVEKAEATKINDLIKKALVVPISAIQNQTGTYIASNVNHTGVDAKDFSKSEKAFDKQTAKANRQANPNGGQSTGGRIVSTLLQVGCGYANAQGIWIPCGQGGGMGMTLGQQGNGVIYDYGNATYGNGPIVKQNYNPYNQ
jgi:hypothetical protein